MTHAGVRLGGFVLLLAFIACAARREARAPESGGSTAEVREPESRGSETHTPPDVSDGTKLTKFQRARLLGHYSTRDGRTGFILDRTVRPMRAKLDGQRTKIVALDDESPSARGDVEYRSADKSIWIRLNPDGDVVSFQGPNQIEGVDVVRDADAAPLR